MGPRRPRRTHLQGSGASGPDSVLEVRDLPPKAWADSPPPGSLAPQAVWALKFPWAGARVGVPCPPVVPSLPCTSGQGEEAQRGWKACLQLWVPSCPCPSTVQMRRPQGPRGQTGCGPWRVATTPWGSLSHGLTAGVAPPWTWLWCLQAGLKRHLSPDLRSQLFLFLPGLTCSRGWDPVSHPESALTAWLQIGLRTLFSQSPPEMEFTSHLWSIHKLLQSTYSVAGIGATQQKYTHDPGKPIFCGWLKNSDSAEWRHQMLTFNYFFKRSNLRITGVQIYTVNTQKNEDHVIWSWT